MGHPFQCIAAVEKRTPIGYLLTACGPNLSSTCLFRGTTVSRWRAGDSDRSSPASTIVGGEQHNGERQAKKPKTENATKAPNIIKLAISPDHCHAIAVTEDKCVHVFRVHSDGKLEGLSQRSMPKRPCAIEVLPDNATILCGDKFGDVYSLPLLPDENEQPPPYSAAPESEKSQAAPTTFKPSATAQTVHTKRNLKSLEAQMKQKNLTPKTKQPLAFEHKLLLGHVSMLTDVSYAIQEIGGRERGYIITADRDEHIRVSRGPPQSHIIEGYCLGHKEFVSKICVIPRTNMLVSGGGDDWIGVWEWPQFKLKWRFDNFQRRAREISNSGEDHIAVSGIWVVPITGDGRTQKAVVIACEKIPVLAFCPVSELAKDLDQGEPVWTFERTDFPVLDITSFDSTTLVSFDSREANAKRICALRLELAQTVPGASVKWLKDEAVDGVWKDLDDITSSTDAENTLDEFLYGISNLRKRTNREDAPDDEGE